jgi:hypothetical protein
MVVLFYASSRRNGDRGIFDSLSFIDIVAAGLLSSTYVWVKQNIVGDSRFEKGMSLTDIATHQVIEFHVFTEKCTGTIQAVHRNVIVGELHFCPEPCQRRV